MGNIHSKQVKRVDLEELVDSVLKIMPEAAMRAEITYRLNKKTGCNREKEAKMWIFQSLLENGLQAVPQASDSIGALTSFFMQCIFAGDAKYKNI